VLVEWFQLWGEACLQETPSVESRKPKALTSLRM
jgi:hypothetical protein